MEQKKRFVTYIIVASVFFNGIFFVYGALKIYKSDGKLLRFLNYTRNRVLVDKKLLYAENTATILTLGQSNSSCFGQGTYSCHNKVYEYFNGDLYGAEEPLLGSFGNGGSSVWSRVSDMLIDSGIYKSVIIIPIGIGSSSVQCWSEGECNKKLKEILDQIRSDNIKVTHIIWHQGETDNIESTSKKLYKARLNSVLSEVRQQDIHCNFYVCVASYHPDQIGMKMNGIDTVIQNSQLEFAKEVKGVRPGANTDLINLAVDRHDGVHFSRVGLNKFATEMYYKLIQ